MQLAKRLDELPPYLFLEISKKIKIADIGHTAYFYRIVSIALGIAIEKRRWLCSDMPLTLIFNTSIFYTVNSLYG